MTERPLSHEAATAVLVASFLAAGAALPPVIGVVAAGVGVEVLGGLTERTWDRIRGRFLTDQVLLDSELQAAMRRAYVHAIRELEHAWWQTTPGIHIKRGPREQREQIEGLFRMLWEDAERILSNERLRELASDPVALQTLGNDASA